MSGLKVMQMRGGTSKGVFLLAEDLPAVVSERDDLLLRIMGSPDPGQRDGLGGGHPLTSKVAVVTPSRHADADVDYLFLQVHVDAPVVTSSQNCGNLLAGVGPFAIERGLVPAADGSTDVRIRMVNSGAFAVATVRTPGREVTYDGDALTSGLSTSAADVVLEMSGTAGSTCGALLPTGHVRDSIEGLDVTCIDNGMPTVVVEAGALSLSGRESPDELEANSRICGLIEVLRVRAGAAMGMGDVTTSTTPKMTIVSAPAADGTVMTRTFIPHRCHTAIGVLGALSVAAAARIPRSVAADVAVDRATGSRIRLEHPSGYLDVECEVEELDGEFAVRRSAVVRTARKLSDGLAWPGPRSHTREERS